MRRLLGIAILLLSFPLMVLSQSTPLQPITLDNVSDLEQLHIIGRGSLNAVDISPDGETLALGTTAGVWFYHLSDLSIPPTYHQYGTGFNFSVRFDATGSYLGFMSDYPDGGVATSAVMELDGAANVTRIIDDAHLSDDGRYILFDDGFVIEIASKAAVLLDFPEIDSFTPDVPTLVTAPGQNLVAIRDDPTEKFRNSFDKRPLEIRLYDLAQRHYVASLHVSEELTHYRSFGKMLFSPDGQWLFGIMHRYETSGSMKIYKWSVADLIANENTLYDAGEIFWESTTHGAYNLQIAGDYVIVTSQSIETADKRIEAIDMEDGTVIGSITEGYLLVHPITGHLITLSTLNGNSWTVQDVTDDTVLGILDDFGSEVRNITFSPDETQMLSINRRNYIRLTNTTTWETISSIDFKNQVKTLIGFQDDGRPIVIAANGRESESEKHVDILDMASGEVIYSFPVESRPNIDLSENGQYLLISIGKNRWLYDISQPQAPQPIAVPDSELTRTEAGFDPESHYLLFLESDIDGPLFRLWDITTQEEVARIANREIDFPYYFGDITRFPEVGTVLALCERRETYAGGLEYQLTLWRMSDLLDHLYPTPYSTIYGPLICNVDFGIRGDIVFPTYQTGVQQWSVRFRNPEVASEDSAWWRAARFGPDGSVVFGIDYFGAMTAWDAADMSELATFRVSPWIVDHIEFIHDGTLMVLPADDGTIRIWGIPSGS